MPVATRWVRWFAAAVFLFNVSPFQAVAGDEQLAGQAFNFSSDCSLVSISDFSESSPSLRQLSGFDFPVPR